MDAVVLAVSTHWGWLFIFAMLGLFAAAMVGIILLVVWLTGGFGRRR